MGCCGHDRATDEVEQRLNSSEAPALARASCPACGYPTQEDFVLCPRCGTELLTACPECYRAVQTDWVQCAYCGADLVAA